MHRASDSIAAIAAALAKAQVELANPEKSLSATIRSPFPLVGISFIFGLILCESLAIDCLESRSRLRDSRRRKSKTDVAGRAQPFYRTAISPLVSMSPAGVCQASRMAIATATAAQTLGQLMSERLFAMRSLPLLEIRRPALFQT